MPTRGRSRLGMLAVAERIMLRGNRYALAAALDGVPLQPWVQPLHGGDTPVYVRVSRPVLCRDPRPWCNLEAEVPRTGSV